jgi:hypothetical protein
MDCAVFLNKKDRIGVYFALLSQALLEPMPMHINHLLEYPIAIHQDSVGN